MAIKKLASKEGENRDLDLHKKIGVHVWLMSPNKEIYVILVFHQEHTAEHN